LLTLNASSGALRRNAVHCPETRKSVVKKAWAMFSGRTNFKRHQIHGPSKKERGKTHLI